MGQEIADQHHQPRANEGREKPESTGAEKEMHEEHLADEGEEQRQVEEVRPLTVFGGGGRVHHPDFVTRRYGHRHRDDAQREVREVAAVDAPYHAVQQRQRQCCRRLHGPKRGHQTHRSSLMRPFRLSGTWRARHTHLPRQPKEVCPDT